MVEGVRIARRIAAHAPLDRLITAEHAPGPEIGDDYDAILDWTTEHEIPLRGHNIFWGVPKFVQGWLKALDDATLQQTLRDRALDIGRRYRGRFAEYDLNNEMIHDNYYEKRLGRGITKEMAIWPP